MDKIRFRTLVLDMDDTLVSLVGPLIVKSQELFPEQQFKIPKYGRYTMWFPDHFSDPKQLEVLKSHVCTEEFYMGLPPTLIDLHNQSLEKFSRLCWSHFDNIKVVTAREGWCPNAEHVSRECLRNNGFLDVDRLKITAVDGKKAKINFAEGSTLFVDDSLTLADAVARSSMHHMILVNHPWNDGYPRSTNITISPIRRLTETLAHLCGQYA